MKYFYRLTFSEEIMRKFALAALITVVASVAWGQTKAPSMTVFGAELGKSVSIPECAINPRMKALGSIVYEVTMDGPEIVCFQRYGDPLGPGGALGLEERVIINFPKSKTPELLVGGSMDGKIMGGTLEELSFFTAGAGTERFFLRALK